MQLLKWVQTFTLRTEVALAAPDLPRFADAAKIAQDVCAGCFIALSAMDVMKPEVGRNECRKFISVHGYLQDAFVE